MDVTIITLAAGGVAVGAFIGNRVTMRNYRRLSRRRMEAAERNMREWPIASSADHTPVVTAADAVEEGLRTGRGGRNGEYAVEDRGVYHNDGTWPIAPKPTVHEPKGSADLR